MTRRRSPEQLFDAARQGDRSGLARALSLVERGGEPARVLARLAAPHTGDAYTVGVTGAPGGGKSTLVSVVISHLRSLDIEPAVLAIDPSSPFSGGAILGDRVRMQDHIDDPGVYIRSVATRGHLGGISEATPRCLAVLDGIGFSEILVETVGVGQAEVDIAGNTDTTVVVLNPRWGDSIQAAKAGLLEVGDVFAVNKADRPGVAETVRDLRQMLELGGGLGWQPPILPTVAETGDGIAELWKAIAAHRRHLLESGELQAVRRARLVQEVRAEVVNTMRRRVRRRMDDDTWQRTIDRVVARQVDPWTAAREIIDLAALD